MCHDRLKVFDLFGALVFKTFDTRQHKEGGNGRDDDPLGQGESADALAASTGYGSGKPTRAKVG
jgi:hypothetical protein